MAITFLSLPDASPSTAHSGDCRGRSPDRLGQQKALALKGISPLGCDTQSLLEAYGHDAADSIKQDVITFSSVQISSVP